MGTLCLAFPNVGAQFTMEGCDKVKLKTKAEAVRSLGFGSDQDVGEQEEVPVLRLHPRLELNMCVEEEQPVRVDEEGLDQRARIWAHGRQEALSGTHEAKTFSG